jgi:peptidoglycan/xylan/chitin deacetylase (PgdA/CDA1 family)
MNLIKSTFYKASSLLPLALSKAMGSFTTLLPYHHTVSNEFLPHIKHLFNYKNVAQFSEDLDFLLKHYKPVTPTDIIKSIEQNNALPKKSFLISFDDGFREVYDVIAPILEQKGVPAVFFINPAFIDNKVLFYRCKISLLVNELIKQKQESAFTNIFSEKLQLDIKSLDEIKLSLKKIDQSNAEILDELAVKIDFSFEKYLAAQQPFLTQQQLISLHNRGFFIGGHSMTHPYYDKLPLQDQVAQTTASCNFVNELLSVNNCCFSFPHTDVGISQHFFENVQSSIPLFFGIQNQKEELENRVLHRFNAERPEVNFADQVKGLSIMMWLKKLTGKNKVTRTNFN